MVTIPAGASRYVYFPAVVFVEGERIDSTTTTLEVAFVKGSGDPADGDYFGAAWESDGVGRVLCGIGGYQGTGREVLFARVTAGEEREPGRCGPITFE